MDASSVIALLMDCINTRKQLAGGTFAALGGTAGNVPMLQRDANAAITLWHDKHNVSGLRQLATTLHMYGIVTDSEYDQIMETLDGEN
ncbi:MAG TPA: hypothetical protein VLG92_00355 [Candidatus Saccharimonadia bacterium]|nr:hypothetical protein [Candidatus Saccharimonadia bacterium]